jgi:hypothetical protein
LTPKDEPPGRQRVREDLRVGEWDRPARLRQDLDREPVVDRERRQRDEDRLKPSVGDQHAVDQPGAGADRETDQAPREHAPRPLVHVRRDDGAGESDHAADGKIEATREDDHGLADRDEHERERVVDQRRPFEVAR